MDLSLGTRRDITKKYAADYAKASKKAVSVKAPPRR
jgi:hypothetical protein